MTKARELAELGAVYDSGALSNRNMIINGAMQVAQRGTSATGLTSSQYNSLDRYRIGVGNAGTWTMSQDADAPKGFGKSLKLSCTTADTDLGAIGYLQIETKIEGQNVQQLNKGTSDALKMTLSFWCKSNKTGDFQVNVFDLDNGRNIGAVVSINSSATWEYKTITYDADTTGTLDDDNNASLRLEFWLDAGTNYNSGTVPTAWEASSGPDRAAGVTLALADSTSNYFQITGVQLEVGESATPFEHRSYGDELARCQRYYYSLTDGNANYVTQGYQYTANGSWSMQTTLPVTMRVAPSLTGNWTTSGYFILYSSDNGGTNVTNLSMNGANTRVATVSAPTIDAGAAGISGGLYCASSLGILAFDAEL